MVIPLLPVSPTRQIWVIAIVILFAWQLNTLEVPSDSFKTPPRWAAGISPLIKEAAISKVYLMPKFVNIQELVGALSRLCSKHSRIPVADKVPQPLGRPRMLSAIEVKVCTPLFDFQSDQTVHSFSVTALNAGLTWHSSSRRHSFTRHAMLRPHYKQLRGVHSEG